MRTEIIENKTIIILEKQHDIHLNIREHCKKSGEILPKNDVNPMALNVFFFYYRTGNAQKPAICLNTREPRFVIYGSGSLRFMLNPLYFQNKTIL